MLQAVIDIVLPNLSHSPHPHFQNCSSTTSEAKGQTQIYISYVSLKRQKKKCCYSLYFTVFSPLGFKRNK